MAFCTLASNKYQSIGLEPGQELLPSSAKANAHTRVGWLLPHFSLASPPVFLKTSTVKKGQVAAATGDNANDAPTLKETNKTFHEDSRQRSSKDESRYPHLGL
ncbi:unnamed protein product, partial [Vitis vinifera]|uniref:Uncharacterized protein n=1 Tax=Vitis vinifera TaxID=29760 RepID=D7SPI4_VITVI